MKALKSILSILLVLAMLLSFAACESKSKKKDDDDDDKSEASSEISTNESSEDISDASSESDSSETSSQPDTSDDTSSQPEDEIKLEGTLIYEDENVALSFVDLIAESYELSYLKINAYNKTDEKVILYLDNIAVNGLTTNCSANIEINAGELSEEPLELYYLSTDISLGIGIKNIILKFSFVSDMGYEVIADIDPTTLIIDPTVSKESYVPAGPLVYDKNGIKIWAEMAARIDENSIDVVFYIKNLTSKSIVCTDNFENDILLDGTPATAIFVADMLPYTEIFSSMSFFTLQDDGITERPSTLAFTLEIYDSRTYEDIDIVPVEFTLQFFD